MAPASALGALDAAPALVPATVRPQGCDHFGGVPISGIPLAPFGGRLVEVRCAFGIWLLCIACTPSRATDSSNTSSGTTHGALIAQQVGSGSPSTSAASDGASSAAGDPMLPGVWLGDDVREVIDGFGPRMLAGVYDFHRGLDLAAERGEPVPAAHAGLVVRAEAATSVGTRGYGNVVVVAYDGPPRQTAYFHLSGFAVAVGDRVMEGESIGQAGDTGVGTQGVHMHLEYQEGRNDGVLQRVHSRNPLRILSYQHDAPRLSLLRDGRSLMLTIRQHVASLDVTRVTFDPAGRGTQVVDFETLEGLNPHDWDDAEYGAVAIEVDERMPGDDEDVIRIRFKGDWAGVDACEIALAFANGDIATSRWAF